MSGFSFLRQWPAVALTVLFLAQAAAFYGLSRGEEILLTQPLREFPNELVPWVLVTDEALAPEVAAVLQPDDYLLRVYENTSAKRIASIFVAYFRSHRTGHAPHSPQNCLPGSGWIPYANAELAIPAEDGTSIAANWYKIQKDGDKSVVLYWYQTAGRTVAQETAARFYLVTDSIRHNRTDTALVRIVVPFRDGSGARETELATGLARTVYAGLRRHIPPVTAHLE